MTFAIAIPWWGLLLLVVAIALVAWASYAGPIVPLPRVRRAALSTLRALTLLLLVGCLLRPVRVVPPEASSDAVVPILVDASRSMSLADAGGRARIDEARDLLEREIRPALAGRFQAELWTFGSSLTQLHTDALHANEGRSDLSGALRSLRERYRERRVAAMVVISDGGDTGIQDAASADAGSVPVYAIGVGAPRVTSDFEVLDVSAGETPLADSSIDLSVTAASHGDNHPFDLRVLENGRPIDVRRVTPAADGGPVRAVFTVSPPHETPTLYTVEIPSASGELVLENNRRSVLVEPPGRPSRVLIVEGAPGFEHSFLTRALAADSGIEVDSIVRKGRDGQGDDTFFVQSTEARAPRLALGFPQDRETLYQYDAIILANIDPGMLSRVQLEMAAGFVGERGGGVLVLGARSFAQQGLVGTAIEEVLPVGLSDRGNGIVRASSPGETPFSVTLTPDGEAHPVMRVGGSAEDTTMRWRAVPALAGAASLGAPRPGAQVLAVVHAPDGPRPLVAVQRYGLGRAMIFTGEASWRWRMQMPSEDRTYELFWRQVARWLSTAAPEPVSIITPAGVEPRSTDSIHLDVRDSNFAPVTDAQITMRITLPGGETQELRPALTDPHAGRYSVEQRFDEPGIYQVTAEARRGSTTLGSTNTWLLVGGADREMADPRLNEEVLRRLAAATGGAYLDADTVSQLPSLLASVAPEPQAPRLQELWQTPWIFGAVILLLASEWVLRRRWGLR